MKRMSQRILWVPVVIAVAAIVILAIRALSPGRLVLVGMVEATQIDVAAKIPGRVDSILVREGDHVTPGQVLATLESREIDAKVEQARGMMAAAQARLDMARHGARPEERAAIENLYNEASHQFDLAEKTYQRIESVYKDSVVSAQERDQVEFKYKAAREERDAARSKYEMVRKGARTEEIEAAEGLFHQAESAYREAQSYQREARLTSRVEGEICKRVADRGEMVAAGYPVFSILDASDIWVTLSLREDQMAGLSIGTERRVTFPALSKTPITMRVTYVAPMGEFATWRATNQKGDFDLKTFEIQLRPTQPVTGLRPGMSARVEL